MVAIIQIQIQIIILVVIGFFVAKKGVFSPKTRGDLTNVIIYIMLPCSIFASFQAGMTIDILMDCLIVFVIAFCIQLLYLALNPLLYRRFPEHKRVVMQYATICNNAGFMGLPVIGAVFGPMGILYGSVVIIPMRLFMWTFGLSLFTKTDKKEQLLRLATHPCIWAVILGVVYLLLPVEMPAFLSATITMVGDCTTPLALIIVGAILSDVDFKTVFEKSCFYFSFIRLIALPLFVYGVLRLIGTQPLVTGVCVLSTGMPAALVTAMLSQQYGRDAAYASKIIFVSTLLSLVTLPLLAALLTGF